ncbi:MAG: SPOR domain-containing protein [Pseudomonadota bacterium]
MRAVIDMGYSEQYDSDGAHTSAADEFSSIFKSLAAVISVSLIAGLGYWGYNLAVRDVSGVPVVRALEGPMRIQPDNPGGQSTDHQGLAVNHVKAEGAAEDMPDQLVLAPAPMALDAEDIPAVEMAEATPEEAPVEENPEAVVLLAALDVEAAEIRTATDRAVAAALAAALTEEGAMPLVEQASLETPAPSASVRSIRPRARPTATLASASVAQPLDPAALAPGTRLVQLGAYPTRDEAEEEWSRLQNTFADFVAGKTPVIQPATTAGRSFYRLRAAGFDDLADARRFCATLMAEDASCIPVVTR